MTDKVKLIKDCFDAFARGDVAYIVARVSDDVDWRGDATAEIPYAGTFKGPLGVGQFFSRMADAASTTTRSRRSGSTTIQPPRQRRSAARESRRRP